MTELHHTSLICSVIFIGSVTVTTFAQPPSATSVWPPGLDSKPRSVPVAFERLAAASTPAKVTFAVVPWGEVHVNGKMQGVSPPLQELQLAPGKHRIELRNGGSPPYVVTVDAKAGERIRIKHKFD